MHLARARSRPAPRSALLSPPRPMLSSTQAGRRGLRRAHRVRQEPDHAPRRRGPARGRQAVAVLRHPMPYGDLAKQAVQRFALRRPRRARLHDRGAGGVRAAHRRGQRRLRRRRLRRDPRPGRAGGRHHPLGRRQQRLAVLPPDLHIVVVDPHRAGHELRYHPGETNLRMADVGREQGRHRRPRERRGRGRLDPDATTRTRGSCVPPRRSRRGATA